jgi:hypothetical protein
MIPMVSMKKKHNYDEYKVNSTCSWDVSSLFFSQDAMKVIS